MPTIHVSVHSDRGADRICEWAHANQISYYAAPIAENGNTRRVVDHVTIMNATNEQAGDLIGYIAANGLKTEITVE